MPITGVIFIVLIIDILEIPKLKTKYRYKIKKHFFNTINFPIKYRIDKSNCLKLINFYLPFRGYCHSLY